MVSNHTLQINDFQKVSFLYHFMKDLKRKFYTVVLSCKLAVQILKIIFKIWRGPEAAD